MPVYRPADLKKLLQTTKGDTFKDRRDLALLLVFIDTGARLSEVVHLAWPEDVVMEDGRFGLGTPPLTPRLKSLKGRQTLVEIATTIRRTPIMAPLAARSWLQSPWSLRLKLGLPKRAARHETEDRDHGRTQDDPLVGTL